MLLYMCYDRLMNTKKKSTQDTNLIYQAKNGAIELHRDAGSETVWATQAQMAFIFGVNPQAITKHLKNIFSERELVKGRTCSKMEQVQIEGKRSIKRAVEIYNLDVIISVGYRISSKTGTKFRQWATKTLRAYISDGFTINRTRIGQNYDAFLQAVDQVTRLLPLDGTVDAESALELIKLFAGTWFSLEAYDKSNFPKTGVTKKRVTVTADDLISTLTELKKNLLKNDEATELFGAERTSGSVSGIIGNVFQAFGGRDVYPTVEEKAAHLLYFMVKNHPFVDGNKRSGAFAFVWFLKRARLLDVSRMTPPALTALTLLVAESNPKEKERMIGLVLLMLKK